MNTNLSLWGCFVKCITEKYCCFSGRATRREYWGYVLFNVLLSYLVLALAALVFGFDSVAAMVLQYVVGLGLLLPSLGVAVRRLHDIGKSGWMLLLGLIPFVGAIILVVWYCKDSQPGANEYGPNPKEVF